MQLNGIVSRNLKAIEAGLGALLMALTLLGALDGVLPASVASGITVSLGVLTTVRVWLAKNEPLIQEAEEALAELVDGTVGAFQIRG